LRQYLPDQSTALVPTGALGGGAGSLDSINERELIFKFLFDMKSDLNALKEQVKAMAGGQPMAAPIPPVFREEHLYMPQSMPAPGTVSILPHNTTSDEDVDHTEVEETLSIEVKEKETDHAKRLVKHRNRSERTRLQELGISERTLYRKIKEYDIP
jgi:DNA-binding NtrC family response regulator